MSKIELLNVANMLSIPALRMTLTLNICDNT